jgi:acetoin utilization deacetylase AcuC-like enzyme
MSEIGSDAGRGYTLNFPFPEGATGDVYLEAIDEVVTGVVTAFGPTWLLISAGFDAHRRDPLTGLALSSGDYSMITRRLLEFVPPGRRLVYLEGGYDLQALADSTGSALAALVGVDHRPEPATTGGPGRHVVHAVRDLWIREGLLAG